MLLVEVIVNTEATLYSVLFSATSVSHSQGSKTLNGKFQK
jgi:hypothetical protein